MFENIIGLTQLCADLTRDLTGGELPRSLLLSGPRYGGKSSLALEIARAVACHEDARWDCGCKACNLHRTLQHPDTILVGPRYFTLEIAAAVDALQREPRVGTRFLVMRSVRKLVRRFDANLWPETRNKKALPVVERVEGLLADLEEEPDLQKLTVIARELQTESLRLEQLLPHDPVPVDLIRAVSSWAHISTAGKGRVVILEEAQALQEGARNAMLKILEEPPENTLFILTSSRKAAIIPTIRSRVRVYEVPPRTEQAQRSVQERIFRFAEAESSLQRFFRQSVGGSDNGWEVLAHRLVDALLSGGETHHIEAEVRERMGAASPRHGAEYFLEALEEDLRHRLRNGTDPDAVNLETRRVHYWGALINRYWSRIDVRNMNPGTVLAGLVLAMKR